MKSHRKHLDFEINLIPCIDLLSVCICFLLLTAVWLNVGSMDVKQAVGGQAASGTEEKKPKMWVNITPGNDLLLEVQGVHHLPRSLAKLAVKAVAGKPNLEELSSVLGQMKASEPNLSTALLQPKAETSYEDIIDIMDRFKKTGLNDLGVVPL